MEPKQKISYYYANKNNNYQVPNKNMLPAYYNANKNNNYLTPNINIEYRPTYYNANIGSNNYQARQYIINHQPNYEVRTGTKNEKNLKKITQSIDEPNLPFHQDLSYRNPM